ncbi:ABC transporter ATP-binding protein [Actinoallomurus rhizosphaericola]|uniref:ABC transporter ATP-binding protein n=1 Tax=Actinoallomurus rhizosphaericola TaxID=2952536 RepID=UPI0020931E5B|nr:ABC transporter ATP-binding protein [Actinoallomurus rhizosphaericola]MCO6000127.1 ABC transporter ATP-binding protein [Actinoallomurus rhizosphaericola]
MNDAVIELDRVVRDHGNPPVRAVDHVSLSVAPGEFAAIVGPSGSGKSSLLNIIGTLDRPTSGRALVDGRDVGALSDAALSALRAYRIGFVFQQFHLALGVSAVDNVADGLLYTGTPRAERRRRAVASLTRVGLAGRLHHKPDQLSGGERQRVAIARAIVSDPALLLADEPTGNLDQRSGAGVMELLQELNETGTTVMMITHDVRLAERIPRRISMRDGQIVADDRELTV